MIINLVGQKFGRLTVTGRAEKDQCGRYKWLCLCDCGQVKVIVGTSLNNGNTRSCGCLQKETACKTNMKHGYYKTSIYKVWLSIIQRCTNPKNRAYSNYGGRGITVCVRWRKFENFLQDMGEIPKNHQIDRVNNNKGYNNTNCRWATPKQNSRNQRTNRCETHDGKRQCISAWAEEYNIPYKVLWNRLYVSNWSIEKALTVAVRKRFES